MKLTTIQLHESTRKKLEKKRKYKRESYDTVINRMLEDEEIPSMQEMFQKCDSIPQDKIFSTEEVIKLSHSMRKR